MAPFSALNGSLALSADVAARLASGEVECEAVGEAAVALQLHVGSALRAAAALAKRDADRDAQLTEATRLVEELRALVVAQRSKLAAQDDQLRRAPTAVAATQTENDERDALRLEAAKCVASCRLRAALFSYFPCLGSSASWRSCSSAS